MMDKRPEDNEKIQKRQDAPRLPAKSLKIMESRRRTLYIQGLVDWVEDALHNVTRQFLGCNGESRTSDYLRMAYPRDFPEEKRRNSTGDERKTLRYRFRYMFRCLMLIADRYEEFEQWKFTGLECMMEIFEEVVRQALGAAVADRFHTFYLRFRGLWKTVNPALNSKDDVYEELCRLMDEADIVFEDMFMECVSRETAREKGTNPDMGEAVEAMQEVAEECREATREQRHAAKLVAKVAGVALVHGVDGEGYGRYEGLETLNENRRAEVKAAIDMSHRDYPVVRKPKCRADPTIGKLAQRCWKANRAAFEKLAKLPREPGYKDEKTFRVTLYALARNYPAADHFRWMTSTAEPAKKVGEKHLNETVNCGTISCMVKGFKNATLALALTAVGVVASCRASGASPDISRGGGVDTLGKAA